jgi:superfamily I DNA and RNA helicase
MKNTRNEFTFTFDDFITKNINMEKNIKNILEELYLVDPSLREKEEELKKIIEAMLKVKPNIKIDENFKESLKGKIFEKITSKKIENYNSKGKTSLFQIFSYIF